jgi:RNA polymerase sigma factor (sigma-70 family)
MSEDTELLRRYAEGHSDEAFAELVRRHVDLVYSAALRLSNGDVHQAQDVTQQVFAEFSRQARRLAQHPAPVGWLYTTTRRAALCTFRNERRRAAREQEASAMNEILREPAPEPDWDGLRPILEEAMHELGDKDRLAVLLRFFQNKSLKDVGAALGLGENAARMRVDRALEKLHSILRKRGVAASSSLAAVLSAQAVQLAPGGLAASIAAAATAGGGVGVGVGSLTLLKIMTATQIKVGLSVLLVAGATTALVLQHQAQAKLRAENVALAQHLAGLTADNAVLSNRLEAVTAAAKAPPADRQDELLRLRGQVAVLQHQKEMLEKAQAKAAPPRPDSKSMTSASTPAPLPDDYPKTADGAARQIFEAMGRGDWDAFLTNFGQPGVPREMYDQVFTADLKSNLAGLQVLSVGEPTNGFYAGHFFVPYKVQFQDGTTKEFRLSVKQDDATKRFYFDGGL